MKIENIEIDTESGAIYIYVQKGKDVSTTALISDEPHVVADLDDEYNVIGIEILT